jgi:hypothetical protein
MILKKVLIDRQLRLLQLLLCHQQLAQQPHQHLP